MDWSGKNVMITGGSSGIGKAAAKLLVRKGAKVHIVARDPTKLQKAVTEIRGLSSGEGGVMSHSGDVVNPEKIREIVTRITRQDGPIDVLINSAGTCCPDYFEKISIEVIKKEMETNVFGLMSTTRTVLPFMKKAEGGHIVNISSIAGFMGIFGYASYGASKFAVCGFSHALKNELEPLGINVSIVFPFDTETPMLERERKIRPLETRIVTGEIKPSRASNLKEWVARFIHKIFVGDYEPTPPEKVGRAIVEGIEKDKKLIFPEWEMAFLYRIRSVVEPLFYWVFKKVTD